MNQTLMTELKQLVSKYANNTALYSKNTEGKYETISFQQLFKSAGEFGCGLLAIKMKRNDHIGIVSDNRKEWIIASLGIMGIGAQDVPRGADSTADEIKYILSHAECPVCLVENESQLAKVLSVKNDLKHLKIIIVMDEEYKKTAEAEKTLKIHTFSEILEEGRNLLIKDPERFDEEIAAGKAEDLATIIYTSGTTGEPKGVMLSHANFLHQARAPKHHVGITETDIAISVLPVWHSFERSVEYVLLFSGAAIAYSRPIAKVMLKDMEIIRPTIFPSVPRIWEGIRSGVYKKIKEDGGIKRIMFDFFIAVGSAYAKLSNLLKGLVPQFKKRIRLLDILLSLIPLILITPLQLLGKVLVFGKLKQKLGGRFRYGISGAGALPPHVDSFFAAAGILLLEGYGLTEAAPICSVRKEKTPVTNTIGPPLPEMEVKILDPEGRKLPPGEKGILYVKGPNVMQGYYKRPEETARVLSEDGWLNTGDLAMQTWKGELKILGREKETIVLMGGENIEPEPMESMILQSELINHVMIVGQDQKYLCALIVPNFEILAEVAKHKGIPFSEKDNLADQPRIHELIKEELAAIISPKKGFKAIERIFRFKLLTKVFEPGKELTHSLKMRRNVIAEIYKQEIMALYK